MATMVVHIIPDYAHRNPYAGGFPNYSLQHILSAYIIDKIIPNVTD
jgi:hypothetical protein